MKVTTEPTGVNLFVSNYWTAESGASVVSYLRKQLKAASGLFPEIQEYAIYPLGPPGGSAKK